MDPVTAMILGKAAEAFGASFGEALGNGLSEWLFGGGNDNAQVQQKLDQIIDRLNLLDQRLGQLTSMVERFPEVVLNILRTESVDDAYDYLTAVRNYMQTYPNYGPPLEAVYLEIVKNWKIIVRKESRPAKLLGIVSLTEIVRTRLMGNHDDMFRDLLDEKYDVARSANNGYCTELEGLLTEARKILASEYFSGSDVVAFSPFLTWSEAAPKLIKFCSYDDEHPVFVYCTKITDEAWLKRQVDMVSRLHQLRQKIAVSAANITAIVPVISLLEKYVETLSTEGTNFVQADFSGHSDVSDELAWLSKSLALRRNLQVNF